jgi:outer membrane protein assembly factor BamB
MMLKGYRMKSAAFPVVFALLCVFHAALSAEDWPVYRHDNQRSGVTPDTIDINAVSKAWKWESAQPPQPAWHGPAKWDAFTRNIGLRSMRDYDPVFYTVTADGHVFFASTADDTIYALDRERGEEAWAVTLDAPVRIAPAWHDGRLYFGADDGFAYCMNAKSGKEIWRFSPAEEKRLIPSNGKMISLYPCRTGVLVEDGIAYCGMALLPWRDSWICAVNAKSGSPEGNGCYVRMRKNVTMEGALLASPNRLYVPQGRSAPLVFNRSDGKNLGNMKEGGGVFAVLTPEMQLVTGPGSQKEYFVAINDPESRDRVATYERGNYMIVTKNRAFILKDEELLSVDRASGRPAWSVPCDCPYTLILAGDTLLAGGFGKVAAFSAETGKPTGELLVEGRAYGLTAADGYLLVSTDTGAIYCFR